jgi:hypothetical protein
MDPVLFVEGCAGGLGVDIPQLVGQPGQLLAQLCQPAGVTSIVDVGDDRSVISGTQRPDSDELALRGIVGVDGHRWPSRQGAHGGSAFTWEHAAHRGQLGDGIRR